MTAKEAKYLYLCEIYEPRLTSKNMTKSGG